MDQNTDKNRSGIPQHNPSKAMDSKSEVEASGDEKTDQDFPGYPHYPAREDMMDKRTGSHRIDADVSDMGTAPNTTGFTQRFESTGGGSNNYDSRAKDAEGVNAGTDSTDEEIGEPQNVSNDDSSASSNNTKDEVEEAADKGSLNP